MVAKDLKQQMQKASDQGLHALAAGSWAKAETAFASAIKHAHQCQDILAKALFQGYRAEARRKLGKLNDARADAMQALAVATKQDCLELIAHLRFVMAEIDFDAGDAGQAASGLLECLEAAVAASDRQTAELAFGKLGRIYLESALFEPARECFDRALYECRDGHNRAVWLGSIGQVLAETGQNEDSIKYYQQALQEARQAGDLGVQSRCLASEALSHHYLRRYQKAIELYQAALALAGEDLANRSTWLGNLGNVYLKLGELEKAIELTVEGLELARRLNDRRAQADHLDTLGDCCLEQGQAEQALAHYTDALAIGQSIGNIIGERVYLANIARAYRRLGQGERSLEFFRQAMRIFDEQRGHLQSNSWKTSFADSGHSLYEDAIQACLDLGRRVEALELVGRAKSRAILDLLGNSPIDTTELTQGEDPEITSLVAKEKELSQKIAKLERIYSQPQNDIEHGHRSATVPVNDLPRLYIQWREVIDQLNRRHPNYATMVAVESLRFGQLRSLWQDNVLSSDTAIFEFFLSDNFMYAAGIWQGCEQPAVNIILEATEIAALHNDLGEFLEMSSTEGWAVPISLCRRLFQTLVAPLVASLPEAIKHLIVVPHGVLHRFPFSALHDGNGYLIQRYSISYLPSASLIPMLAKLGSQKKNADSMHYLVSAISDYSKTRDETITPISGRRSAAGLEDLSHTLEEANTVFQLAARNTNESRLLTNDQVKDGLISMFSQFEVVHFAGHAIFNPDEPMASGLVLSDGSILTAARILQERALRTDCGKLLVLSACQTGINVITSGGEILGLARALIYAGMPNLVLSLWEVADRSTATLMENFHKCFQSEQRTVAEGLAKAQRTAIEQRQSIHAWAPFIHFGID